jgi:hypothetical protein
VLAVLRLNYIMMDPTADDLLTASIGRSPRNDPHPPGPHHADYHGLPLEHAADPASTEARSRHWVLESTVPGQKFTTQISAFIRVPYVRLIQYTTPSARYSCIRSIENVSSRGAPHTVPPARHTPHRRATECLQPCPWAWLVEPESAQPQASYSST